MNSSGRPTAHTRCFPLFIFPHHGRPSLLPGPSFAHPQPSPSSSLASSRVQELCDVPGRSALPSGASITIRSRWCASCPRLPEWHNSSSEDENTSDASNASRQHTRPARFTAIRLAGMFVFPGGRGYEGRAREQLLRSVPSEAIASGVEPRRPRELSHRSRYSSRSASIVDRAACGRRSNVEAARSMRSRRLFPLILARLTLWRDRVHCRAGARLDSALLSKIPRPVSVARGVWVCRAHANP